MLASVLGDNKTILKNCSEEPEVVDLINFKLLLVKLLKLMIQLYFSHIILKTSRKTIPNHL